MRHFGLRPSDWMILLIYLTGVVVLGSWFSRGRTRAKDFYLAGQRMSWIPVGLSTVAALISGNTYLGLPSEVRSHGLAFLIIAFSIFLAIPVTLRVFLPFYRGLQVTSAYEYLEKRFDVWVRCLASGMFVIWRLIWIAMVIYVPSLTFSAVTGAPMVYTILALGFLTTLYTALGGIEGVIWTDVVQFFVMFGGALVTVWIVSAQLDSGFADVWRIASEGGRTQLLDFSWDPTVRMTFWGAMIGGAFANLAYLGADQMVVQRYLTAKSSRDAQWSVLLSSVGTIFVVVPLALIGLALYAFYHLHPNLVPTDFSDDKVFPYFIATEFPAGFAGLLIAAIFAATMSSLSSGINAITTALDIDFYQRLIKQPRASSQDQNLAQVRFSRILSVLIGAGATGLACFIGRLGTIIEIGLRFIDGFSGPLLGLFLLGMFTKRTNSVGACTGAVLGILATTYANFFSRLSFTWFPAIGCIVTLLGGYLTSRLGKEADPAVTEWVYGSQQTGQLGKVIARSD